MMRNVLLSWSGGKDSALALDALRSDPATRVVGLLTSVTRSYDRVSIHGVRRALLEAQAHRLALPLFIVDLEAGSSNAAYERAFLEGVAAARRHHPEIDAMAFGDLFLDDVRAYRERLLAPTGLTPMFPLWGRDTAELARHFIARGFEARLVCVDTTQLDASFAGRAYDRALLDALPASVDPCGERGEFHTFVSAGPPFDEPIACDRGESVLRDSRFMFADLVPAAAAQR